jgi:hypothetical protein
MNFIDFEGFPSVFKGEVIVKELAVLQLQRNQLKITCRLYAAPYPWHTLPRHTRVTCKWLTRYRHGFKWENGYRNYTRLSSDLKELCSEGVNWTKGQCKAEYLSELIGIHVYNLEDLGMHSITHLRCAVKKVRAAYEWVRVRETPEYAPFHCQYRSLPHHYMKDNQEFESGAANVSSENSSTEEEV